MTRQTKDPKGGLTAAGRREFARKEGAQLKPGVKKLISEMTPEEMKRKGSWAARFYGRKKLPALKDKDGKPTRFALTAAAWGARSEDGSSCAEDRRQGSQTARTVSAPASQSG